MIDDRQVVSFRFDRGALRELASRRQMTPSALLRELVDREMRRQQRAATKIDNGAGHTRQDASRAVAQPTPAVP